MNEPVSPSETKTTIKLTCPSAWVEEIRRALDAVAGEHITLSLPVDLPELLKRIHWVYVERALAASGGNVARAAAMLGIKRTTLSEQLKRSRLS